MVPIRNRKGIFCRFTGENHEMTLPAEQVSARNAIPDENCVCGYPAILIPARSQDREALLAV